MEVAVMITPPEVEDGIRYHDELEEAPQIDSASFGGRVSRPLECLH